jgi:hypothetical protein
MDKNKLVKLLSDTFSLHEFRKKRNDWIKETAELVKLINLQQSRFGNLFYLNYGFIIKSLETQNLRMHIFYGFGSTDDIVNDRIKQLLDFETNISDQDREKELTPLLENLIIAGLEGVNSESDILQELNTRSHLNDVPLLVKEHFGIADV